MQVFKAYFKVIRKHISSLLIYLIIFVVIAIIVTNALHTQVSGTFAETKTKIAFFNDDGDSKLAEGLKSYLAQSSQIIDVKDDAASIQDALFFEQIEYVLRVPEGFTKSFMSGGDSVNLQKTAVSASEGSINADFLVNKYLNDAALYVKNAPGISEADIVGNVSRDLSISATVDLSNFTAPTVTSNLSYYFQFYGYSILAILIMGVTTIMLVFSDKELNNRNLCSPVSQLKMNFQLVLGNVVFALIVWVVLCAMSFIMYGGVTLNAGTILLCVNALVFTFTALSIGFLAGKFIKSHGAQAAISNVLSLGMSFISGVFVEQELLGKTVLNIASFTPSYWYVKAVNDIRSTVDFSAQNLAPVINSMLIQLGFAAALLIIALAVSKQRRRSLA